MNTKTSTCLSVLLESTLITSACQCGAALKNDVALTSCVPPSRSILRVKMALHILVLLVMMAASPVVPRLVELSYTYNIDAPTSPKLKPFRMTVLQNGTNDLGIWQVHLLLLCDSNRE